MFPGATPVENTPIWPKPHLDSGRGRRAHSGVTPTTRIPRRSQTVDGVKGRALTAGCLRPVPLARRHTAFARRARELMTAKYSACCRASRRGLVR